MILNSTMVRARSRRSRSDSANGGPFRPGASQAVLKHGARASPRCTREQRRTHMKVIPRVVCCRNGHLGHSATDRHDENAIRYPPRRRRHERCRSVSPSTCRSGGLAQVGDVVVGPEASRRSGRDHGIRAVASRNVRHRHRPHGGIKPQTPISRHGLDTHNLMRLHSKSLPLGEPRTGQRLDEDWRNRASAKSLTFQI